MWRTAIDDEDYLALIGRLAYTVSSLEGFLIFDLPVVDHGSNLDVEILNTLPTGGLARRFSEAAAVAEDDIQRAWLSTGAAALSDAAQRRNDVLHARPATDDTGRQRLLRRRRRSDVIEQFWITSAHIQEQITALEEWSSRIYKVRLPRRAASS